MHLRDLLLVAASVLGGTLCTTSARVVPAVLPRQSLLQDLVTFDEHSLLIRGERLFIYSGEFHPFRLPVPGLWLDVFQKIKSLGFNGVSFYTDWGLLEGSPGTVNLEGIFDLGPFFDAAAEAGIYLIARPGPYINAETAAGGLPGWTLRIGCRLRSNCTEYEDATKTYLATVGRAIAAAQITNGGPVILVQPENEYSTFYGETAFPAQGNREYMAFVEQQLRAAGIVVPFIDNDNEALGYWAPGTGLGAVDIYGIDAYPVRYDCSQPDVWPTIRWPTNWQTLHQEQSPSTPFSIPEFQGGTGTSWGGVSQDQCAALVGPEALRVFYKNNYSFGVKLLNIYMTYGGTNWGNLGYQGGDSSYDYGASINEFRQVWREKYSEQKLQAQFFRVSPAYLTAAAGNATNGTYADTVAVSTTPLLGRNGTNFYVVRQANWTSTAPVSYTLTLNTTSPGGGLDRLTIPQLGGRLSLLGRDAKVVVTDYDVGGTTLVYSTADVLTWAKSAGGRRVLIVYGGEGEVHELAVPLSAGRPSSTGTGVKVEQRKATWVVQWPVRRAQQTLFFAAANLEVRLLWRNDAFNHWVLELPAAAPIGNYSSPAKPAVIVKGGYLLRTAAITGTTLSLTGDFNATTSVELVFDPTDKVDSLVVNGQPVHCRFDKNGGKLVGGTVPYKAPSTLGLPDFARLTWRTVDSLPEIRDGYDDSRWTAADHASSTNNQVNVSTPTSLFASDYGYHQGSLLYRGHFTANGRESTLSLNISGGWGFGYAVYLNSTFLGSWLGSDADPYHSQTFRLPGPRLRPGAAYVITVLQDHMGQDEEGPGTDAVKFPMGVLDYSLVGHPATDVTWKLTGNLGGEAYVDKVRGPKNEGAMYAERQGYHLPAPPSDSWRTSNPVTEGLAGPGLAFYSTSFDLHIPAGYDVPLGFAFANNTAAGGAYRVQLFVNGYQFGKLIPYLGPQFVFPVPEGVLNYNGTNYVGLTLWALEEQGASLGRLTLEPQMVVSTALQRPALSPQPAWEARPGAY
ncbi:hypothetical protein SCUCBS95973_003297 [Sporothrix curviconia]|uniref:Beta-galactosidase n=1 Tax=Sporothrix curviconia TaxID=1260050 RepID=A0ABP0BFF6_9PEZI